MQRVEEPAVQKLVMRVEGRARPAVRTLRAMLGERKSPLARAKLIVNTDVLIILYLTEPRPAARRRRVLWRSAFSAV